MADLEAEPLRLARDSSGKKRRVHAATARQPGAGALMAGQCKGYK